MKLITKFPSKAVAFASCAVVLVAAALSGCSSKPAGLPGDEGSARKVAVQLNWFAESEHGGVYQAAADGTYKEAGFDVEVRPGGAGTPVAAEVILGRADFAITNADDVVLFRAAGSDIVALVAAMQNHPRCILVREESGVKTFDDLKGMTLQREEKGGFVEFLRKQGKLEGVKEVPYQGSIGALAGNPKVAIQAYLFAEPYLAKGEGMQVKTLMVSDLGWNPYSSVLVTRGDLIRSNPEMVRKFVAATRKGWQNYVTDPTLGNVQILAANQHGMTQDALTYGATELVKLAMPEPMKVADVGTMNAERWQKLVTQMEEINLIKPGSVRPEECYDLSFLEPESTGSSE
ncbi:MAG TPA: ABC transporter permease [Planctomycetaceae bacterium]|nr:ABC transporter permease [Planctomycetaceae bacterium]